MSKSDSSRSTGANSTELKRENPHSYTQKTSLGLALVLITVVSIFVVLVALTMMQLWPKDNEQLQTSSQNQPSEVPSNTIDNSTNTSLFGWRFNISTEERLFVLVLLGGALGGGLITASDLAWDIWYASLSMGMLAWYLIRPLMGAGLGLAFYLVIRGGFFSPQANVDQTNPFTFVGLAVLVGLFSDQANEKLGKIAEAVFTKSPTDSNQSSGGSSNNSSK